MSVESWKKKFYPVETSKIKSKIEAIEHSILKWRGLQKSNLKKHKLYLCNNKIIYNDNCSFPINDKSCALCNLYLYKNGCINCPLQIHLNIRCDVGYNSPYFIFCTQGDTKPMLKALKETLKKAEKDEL